MNATTALQLSVVMAGAIACRTVNTELSEAHADAIRDSVRAAVAQFQRYSENANWDSLAALYSDAPGFRFLETGSVRYSSAGEIREALAQLPPGMRVSTTLRDTEVDPIGPGVAVFSGLFATTFSDTAGAQFEVAGALTLLWIHEPDGWRIRSGHSSAPVPRGG